MGKTVENEKIELTSGSSPSRCIVAMAENASAQKSMVAKNIVLNYTNGSIDLHTDGEYIHSYGFESEYSASCKCTKGHYYVVPGDASGEWNICFQPTEMEGFNHQGQWNWKLERDGEVPQGSGPWGPETALEVQYASECEVLIIQSDMQTVRHQNGKANMKTVENEKIELTSGSSPSQGIGSFSSFLQRWTCGICSAHSLN